MEEITEINRCSRGGEQNEDLRGCAWHRISATATIDFRLTRLGDDMGGLPTWGAAPSKKVLPLFWHRRRLATESSLVPFALAHWRFQKMLDIARPDQTVVEIIACA